MYNTLNRNQIRVGSLSDSHFAADAAIAESKLAIDWALHTTQILASRTVVDYVQVNGKAVTANASNITVTANVSAPKADDDSARGAIVQDGKNRVIIRDGLTGEPVIGAADKEVYGKLTHNGTDFVLTFFTKDGGGAEVSYTFVDATTIDFQFPQRFDLSTVSETFASNEKFVDGAADVSTRLDFDQLRKDIFGGAYTLDHDGETNRAKTLYQELLDEIARAEAAESDLQDAIDAEATARTNADNGLDARLTTAEGDIVDHETRVSAIEAELLTARNGKADLDAELDAIRDLATTSNDEVVNSRKSTGLTGSEVTHASLDARLEATDVQVKANQDAIAQEITDRASAVSAEATARTNADDALDARATALEAIAHKPYAEDKKIGVADPLIGSSAYLLAESAGFVVGDKSLNVYLNGMLLMVGEHYTETADAGDATKGIGVSFAPSLLEQGDVIQLRWNRPL